MRSNLIQPVPVCGYMGCPPSRLAGNGVCASCVLLMALFHACQSTATSTVDGKTIELYLGTEWVTIALNSMSAMTAIPLSFGWL